LPVQHYRSFRVSSPRSTHTKPATCAEFGCIAHFKGWDTVVPETSPDPQAFTAATVRAAAKGLLDMYRRHCTEERMPDGMVKFRFPPGQRCFRWESHRVSLNRPELYIVRGGDWRANTGLIRRHTGPRAPELWVEDSQETFDKVRRVL
jgi:hypothetical protein